MTANRSHDAENDAENDTDLDWLAFQYAAGELRGTELDQFEQLLATDERACAALAQAVLLGQAVVRCEQSARTVVVPARITDRRPAWQTIAVACSVACVAVGVGWWKPWSPAKNSGTAAASEVATLWIQGADEDLGEAQAVHPHDVPDVDAEEDDAVPGWMLAAVTHQQQAADDEEIMND